MMIRARFASAGVVVSALLYLVLGWTPAALASKHASSRSDTSYVNSPRALTTALTVAVRPYLFLAGQLIGVEGYVESAATGLLCGLNAARVIAGETAIVPPTTTALGSLLAYVTARERKDFQPMNANYGLFPPLPGRMRGRDKKRAHAARALADLAAWMHQTGIANPTRASASTAL